MTSDEIKRIHSMREVMEDSGIRINSKGFCNCPFHSEKTASMKVYTDSYYCYGCGASGDIFTFLQRYYDMDFKTAYASLGGTYEKTTKERHALSRYRLNMAKTKREIEEAKSEAHKQEVISQLKDVRFLLRFTPFNDFSDEWCELKNAEFFLLMELEGITDGH